MLSEVLEQARRQIAGGWSEPLSLDADGFVCDHRAEGINRFCLFDALQASVTSGAEHIAAEAALVERLRMEGPLDLATWLEEPERKRADVVLLLGQAAARARAVESR